MVRGLVIRQFFILFDLALVILIVFTAGMVVYKLFEIPEGETVASVPGAGSEASGEGGSVLGERSGYDRILESGLFGDAGRWDPDAEPVAPPVIDPTEGIDDTELNLKLHGTIALSPTDPFSAAFIENMDQRGSKRSFGLGEEVVEKVTLEEVYPREVIILNAMHTPPKQERLRMHDEEDEAPAPKIARAMPKRRPTNTGSTDRVTLNKQEFIKELYVNYADLVTKVKPEMYRDANGRVIGVTAQNIGEVPLAKKLGLSDGDVLQTVNNEPITSEQKVLEMVQKYRNSSSFRVGIIRNGKPKVITYRLE